MDNFTIGGYGAGLFDKGDVIRMTDAEKLLESYFAKYEPPMVKLGKALRAKLRARLPGFCEIVYLYENQKSLVISYSPTENGYEGLFSLALYPTELKLFFAKGASLAKSDPNKLLQGRATVRYVEINAAADFDRAEIEALVAGALKLAKVSLVPSAKGSMVIKAEEQKQRASRTKKAAKPAAAPRKAKAKR